MFYVKELSGKNITITTTTTTFLAACKWCVNAAKQGDTASYGIWSRDKPTKKTPNPPNILETEFEVDLT
jgi:hypothetical protein